MDQLHTWMAATFYRSKGWHAIILQKVGTVEHNRNLCGI